MTTNTHGGSRVRNPEGAAKARQACAEYIRQHQPCTSQDVCDFLGASFNTVRHHLFWCQQYGLIKATGKGGSSRWVAIEQPQKPVEPEALPIVNVVPDRAWLQPGPVVTRKEGSTRYTYQAAPRGRFDVDLKPGTGVISRDNPRLAALARSD